MASSFQLRDLLDREKQVLIQHGSQAVAENSVADASSPQPSAMPALGVPMNPGVRQECAGSLVCSQLVQLARELIHPAEESRGRGSSAAVQSPHHVVEARAEATNFTTCSASGNVTQRQPRSSTTPGFGTAAAVTVRDKDDISMAELDVCMATGSGRIEVELQTVGVQGAAASEAEAVPSGPCATAETGKATVAFALRQSSAGITTSRSRAPGLSQSITQGAGAQQRPLLRCSSPLDLSNVIKTAQARASMVEGTAPVVSIPAIGPGMTGVADALTSTHRSVAMIPATQPSVSTPVSENVRLVLPEPIPVINVTAVQKPRHEERKGEGSATAVADKREMPEFGNGQRHATEPIKTKDGVHSSSSLGCNLAQHSHLRPGQALTDYGFAKAAVNVASLSAKAPCSTDSMDAGSGASNPSTGSFVDSKHLPGQGKHMPECVDRDAECEALPARWIDIQVLSKQDDALARLGKESQGTNIYVAVVQWTAALCV